MTTAVIVQARMGSTRLPGKVLLNLAGRTVLSHVLERCDAISNTDVVCCAIPDTGDSDPVAEEAERCGAVVVRGSERDVLDRYRQAAEVVRAKLVMRVTSDCPLIDPEICSKVLALRAKEDADYACNNMPPSWPHGLDCEAFTVEALNRASREAQTPHEREHVTPWLRTRDDIRHANFAGPGHGVEGMRWTLDYPEDFEFLTALSAHLPGELPGYGDVLAVLERHPEITAMNAARIDRARGCTASQLHGQAHG